MAKLTFKWKANGEEAKPSKRDIENLRQEHYVFQMDFLMDVIFEAKKLYNEVAEESKAYWDAKLLEALNDTSSTH